MAEASGDSRLYGITVPFVFAYAGLVAWVFLEDHIWSDADDRLMVLLCVAVVIAWLPVLLLPRTWRTWCLQPDAQTTAATMRGW